MEFIQNDKKADRNFTKRINSFTGSIIKCITTPLKNEDPIPEAVVWSRKNFEAPKYEEN